MTGTVILITVHKHRTRKRFGHLLKPYFCKTSLAKQNTFIACHQGSPFPFISPAEGEKMVSVRKGCEFLEMCPTEMIQFSVGNETTYRANVICCIGASCEIVYPYLQCKYILPFCLIPHCFPWCPMLSIRHEQKPPHLICVRINGM